MRSYTEGDKDKGRAIWRSASPPPALTAVESLQRRALRLTDNYELERHDRALDELVAHLDRTSPAQFQTRSALANAAKVIRSRRRIAPTISLESKAMALVHHDEFCRVDLAQWVETSASLSFGDRSTRVALIDGHDAVSLAAERRTVVPRTRESISRARRAGREAYRAEAVATS
ncbi:MAG: hypothetical protein WKF57_01535 [Nakamurella sp.]